MSDSLWPHGLQPTRLLCPWDSPGKNTWVAISFSRGSSWSRDRTCISCTAGRFFTAEPPGKTGEVNGGDQKLSKTNMHIKHLSFKNIPSVLELPELKLGGPQIDWKKGVSVCLWEAETSSHLSRWHFLLLDPRKPPGIVISISGKTHPRRQRKLGEFFKKKKGRKLLHLTQVCFFYFKMFSYAFFFSTSHTQNPYNKSTVSILLINKKSKVERERRKTTSF